MGKLRTYLAQRKTQAQRKITKSKNHRMLFEGGDYVICDLIRKEDVNGDFSEKVIILSHDIEKAKHDPFNNGYNIEYTYRYSSDDFPVFDENHNVVKLNKDDMIVFNVVDRLA